MKNTMKIIAAMLALLAVAVSVQAESRWADYDGASPFIVRYKDADKVGTLTIAATAVTATDDSNANAISLTPSLTLASLVASINAATNASGDKNFEAMIWAGISADTVSNQIVAASATTITREWNTLAKWDTSVCLHYDVVVNPLPFGAAGSVSGGFLITDLLGEPAGTGDRTVSVYVDGTRKFYQTVASPVFVPTIDGTVNVANAKFDLSDIDLGSGIQVGEDEVGFVRAACVTTATTGGIGACVVTK